MGVLQKATTSKRTSEGWYDKYRSSDFIFIDCEKVEVKSDWTKMNAKGKVKLFDMKAGEVAICDIKGTKVYETLIYREPGGFRLNPHAKNKFKTSDCLKNGKKIELVHQELRNLFEGKCIVGVDLEQDFVSLDLEFGEFSENAFDLQHHYYDEELSSRGKPTRERWSLKRMCKELLGKDVQAGDHTGFEDACSTAAVFQKYMDISPPPESRM